MIFCAARDNGITTSPFVLERAAGMVQTLPSTPSSERPQSGRLAAPRRGQQQESHEVAEEAEGLRRRPHAPDFIVVEHPRARPLLGLGARADGDEHRDVIARAPGVPREQALDRAQGTVAAHRAALVGDAVEHQDELPAPIWSSGIAPSDG